MILRLIIRTIANFLFTFGLGILIFTYAPLAYSEVRYLTAKNTETNYSIDDKRVDENISEGSESENVVPIVPVDKDFSVIITEIDVNAPVVKDVTTVNQNEYMDALKNGVAHARGTALPGHNGNMFIFAHSSLNFWQLGKYATVFNLLDKLEPGDSIIFYYEGKPYVYEVFQKKLVSGWDTRPFADEYDVPVVTLVTCYPPGTTKDRLIIKAKM